MMRGKLWKRAAGTGLILAVTLGLCACGKDKNVNASLAKEGVYSVQAVTLPVLDYDYYYVNSSAYRDGTIYLLMEVEKYQEEYWSGMVLVSMKDDGTDAKISDFEMPGYEKGTGKILPPGSAPADGTASPDEQDTADPEEDADTVNAPMESAEDWAVDEPWNEGGAYTWENNYYNDYAFGSDGKVYAVRTYYYNYDDPADPEAYVNIEKYFLSCWEGEGKFLWDRELEGLRSEEEWYYIQDISVAADGSVNLLLGGDTPCMMTVDAQGNVSEKLPLPDEATELLSNISYTAYAKDDGTFLLLYYDENWEKRYIARFDVSTGVVEELGELPTSMNYNAMNMRPGISSDLVYRSNLGIYTYNAGDEEPEMKMSFINSDLNITSIYGVIETGEDSFVAIYAENYGEMQAGIFTRVDPESIPEKSVLVLAGNYIGSDIKQRVVEYNRSNEKYRIVIKDYRDYMTYDDYNAGVKQLNNDIVSGKMPDIMIAEGLPTENYAAKGWLADIRKLIEKDEELSKVEFVENVFDAYSVDGKLYYVIPQFFVRTMIGKASIVGDRTSWTMSDAMQLLDSMPEGTSLLEASMTRSDFFYTLMQFCGGDFIDVSTGKCDFDSPNFIQMLEYAKTLPEEFVYDDDYWMKYDYDSQYRDNKVILMRLYLSSFQDVFYNVNGMFGGDVAYIGFPTESGRGSVINAESRYAISARSSYTDGAWEFVRYYLTDEYQSEIEWNFPVQKQYFTELSKTVTEKPYYLDENGEKVEYDYTYWMNDEEVVIDPLTQEQLDQLLALIYSVDKCFYSDDEITNIVMEEIAPYFAGQKTAEEVVKIIQSRAQLYVDVNR